MISLLRRTAWTHLRRLKPYQTSNPCRCLSDGSDDGRSDADIEFTKRLRNLPESERFGSYAKKFSVTANQLDIHEKMSNLDEKEMEEEKVIEDIESHVRLSPVYAPKDRRYFISKINRLMKNGEYDSAKEVLYNEMLQQYRVKPTTHICNKIMTLHGRLGEAEEARQLLKKMFRLRAFPDNLTFGSAFVAYTHANEQEFAKDAAVRLYDFLCRRELRLNYEVYSRIIMCFSRNGNLPYMMRALDDMFMRSPFRPDSRIFLYVLNGCLSDKENGAGLALEVWHRFKQMKKMSLTHKHFNLLVKCICECGLGDTKQMATSLIGSAHKIDYMSLISSGQADDAFVSDEAAITTDSDLKFEKSHIDSSPVNLISSEAFTAKPADLQRYLLECSEMPFKYNISLIGGIEGLFKTMENEGLDINLHIITTLLHYFGKDEEFKGYMLDLAESKGLDKDLALYNELISNSPTQMERDEILKEMTAKNMKPDIITYGAYSKGTVDMKEVRSRMNTMVRDGHVPNLVIFSQFYQSAKVNFHVKRFLLEKMLEYGVYPDKQFIERVENDIHEFRELWLKYEDNESVPEAVTIEHIRWTYLKFVSVYRRWLCKMPLEEIEL